MRLGNKSCVPSLILSDTYLSRTVGFIVSNGRTIRNVKMLLKNFDLCILEVAREAEQDAQQGLERRGWVPHRAQLY